MVLLEDVGFFSVVTPFEKIEVAALVRLRDMFGVQPGVTARGVLAWRGPIAFSLSEFCFGNQKVDLSIGDV
jgi:hypothetical protein